MDSMPSYLFGNMACVAFSNGAFQAAEQASGDWTFGFGDEYTFQLEDLIEFINFLEEAGVISMSSPSDAKPGDDSQVTP